MLPNPDGSKTDCSINGRLWDRPSHLIASEREGSLTGDSSLATMDCPPDRQRPPAGFPRRFSKSLPKRRGFPFFSVAFFNDFNINRRI
jgi:hypothetical protein